ncbi:MAG: glycoside hydrolase family 78 protein [Tannerella sp.]|jgi:alpha-L-rhamnosidase|nr:glycoside hydrolase family 78 protein [Tannerella sp.]
MKKQLSLLTALIAVIGLSAQNRNNQKADLMAETGNIAPVGLTCEYLENPPVVDALRPRLSWINKPLVPHQRGQKQMAWQICVASSCEKLLAGEADLWDSGKQRSEQSVLVKYGGIPLRSAQDCWWRVRVWDNDDRPSAWSETATWSMGLLDPSEWKAKWIGAPWQGEEPREALEGRPHVPAPLLRKNFVLTKSVKSAKAFVTGLGYFEFYVNGEKVGDDALSPNQTNYGKRDGLDKTGIPIDDKFRAYRVLYLRYDITPMLKQGENVVGAITGNGFYNPVINWTKAYGSPRFIGQIYIMYEDGTQDTIISDETWQAHPSAITLNGIYAGEIYDAQKEIKNWASADCNTANWTFAALRKPPEGIMSAQMSLRDKIKERLSPVSVTALDNGVYEVDFGQEISGWIRLEDLAGTAGDTVEIKYISESPNNGVHKYVMKGVRGESHAPRFTWYVFRKVHVINYPGELTADRLTAEAVYSDIAKTGNFECSNNLFNRINHIWQRSLTDNLHGGIMSDCPHRERSAYTGDGQVACVTVMHNFEAAAFYTKWIRDISDAQNTETGYVPNGAPWQPGCGGGVAWGAAMNIMPWEFYLHYGDADLLSHNYDYMKQQLKYMLSWKTPEGTMLARAPKDKESVYWMNLGEWCPPYGMPSDELVHTYFLWRCADLTASAAKVLAYTADEKEYRQLAQDVKKAFHQKFYNETKASYGDFGSNIFALKMGVPKHCREKVVETLREEINACNGHLNTGIFGTQLFFEILAENGLNDIAYTAMNKRDFPSFGHWIAQGATTTWEQWNGENSRNHPMFGGALTWFYRKVAGLNADEERPGYKHIIIRPMPPDSLSHASYTTRTPYGDASVSWQCSPQGFRLQAVVPTGTTATIHIPCSNTSRIKESGTPAGNAKGIIDRGWHDGYRQFEVVSGIYDFRE